MRVGSQIGTTLPALSFFFGDNGNDDGNNDNDDINRTWTLRRLHD